MPPTEPGAQSGLIELLDRRSRPLDSRRYLRSIADDAPCAQRLDFVLAGAQDFPQHVVGVLAEHRRGQSPWAPAVDGAHRSRGVDLPARFGVQNFGEEPR